MKILRTVKLLMVLSSFWIAGIASAAVIVSASTFGAEIGLSSYIVRSPTSLDMGHWVDASCSSGAAVIVGDCSRVTTAVYAEVTLETLVPIVMQFGAVAGERGDQYTSLEFLMTNHTGVEIHNLLLQTGYMTSDGFQPHQYGSYGGVAGYLPSFGFSEPPYPLSYASILDSNSGMYGLPNVGELWADRSQLRGIALLGTPDSSFAISGQVYPFAVRFTPNAELVPGHEVPEPAPYALVGLGLAQLLLRARRTRYVP